MNDSQIEASRPISVAYLILSHYQPDRVEALGHRILQLSERSAVFVHHDASSTELPWKGVPPDSVHFVSPRINVAWGRWSQVEAMLTSLEFANAAGDFDWFVFLSGQDWPSRNLTNWEQELASSPFNAFIEGRRVEPSEGTVDLDSSYLRYNYRWLILSRPNNVIIRRTTSFAAYALAWATRWLKNTVAVVNFYDHGWAFGTRRQNALPASWSYYKGGAFITLDRKAVNALLHHQLRKQLSGHFSRTLLPDEAFIHTILYNCPEINAANFSTTFAPWEKRRDNLILRADDLDDIRASAKPFARKVVPAEEAEILRLLDELVDSEDELPARRPSIPRD